jgi:hypothetical protein
MESFKNMLSNTYKHANVFCKSLFSLVSNISSKVQSVKKKKIGLQKRPGANPTTSEFTTTTPEIICGRLER